MIGTFHRSASDGRGAVPDQDPLLLPGSDAGGAPARSREKLPHFLSDAGRSHAGGTRPSLPRRLLGRQSALPQPRRHPLQPRRGRPQVHQLEGLSR